MRKLQHVNLLERHSKEEVYAALQGHYDRDTYYVLWWKYAALAGVCVFIWRTQNWEVIPLVAAAYCLAKAVMKYVDNSNRNWAMHVIDWAESQEGKKPGATDDTW